MKDQYKEINTYVDNIIMDNFNTIFQDIKDFIYLAELNYLNDNEVTDTKNYEKANKILIKDINQILKVSSILLVTCLKSEMRRLSFVFSQDLQNQKSIQLNY